MKMISVIIPCFNASLTLYETLASLEENNREVFEVLIVDDGSSDQSLDIVKKYASVSNLQIRVYHQPNLGVSAARNLGIDNAEGKYLLFLDADDLLASHYIDFVASLLENKDFDTVASYRTSSTSRLKPVVFSERLIIQTTPYELLKTYTYSKSTLGFTSFLYKKDILLDYNIRFTVGAKYGEDIEFLTKFLSRCESSILIDCYYYYYRVNQKSVSHSVTYHQIDVIKSSERADNYLSEINHPFSAEFHLFMVPRAVFSCVHRFSKFRNKALFDRLLNEFDVKMYLASLGKNKNVNFFTKMCIGIFLVSPALFYYTVGRF